MAFTVDDLKEFLAALRDHPEWRDQVRDEIMAEDMRALPGIVRQLGERMDQLTDRVGELALRLDQLTDRVGELTLRLDQLTDRLEQLTTNVNAGFNDLRGRVGNLEGWRYETKFNARSRVATIIRKPVAVTPADLDGLLDALEDGTLSDAEWNRLNALDFLFRGRLGKGSDAPEVLLALEVSLTVDGNDVARASARAATLQQLGFATIAAVGGRRIMPGAQTAAEAMNVRLLIDSDSEEESDAA